ncbi:DNA-directed DNA polymerase [Caerostris darwini]|uniref:DNA-directed DNA polymerase n=1 Tax=Caerostris darwini TaxID=1538125 RepID=A0AAV4Q7N0_9ARAC|nr:DNA-directed DNA polymerase [Caerostris darwini]
MLCPPGQSQRCKDCERLVYQKVVIRHAKPSREKKNKPFVTKNQSSGENNYNIFDGHGLAPDVVPNGGLIMSILHPSLMTRIIDSSNFLPMSLSKITDCFGLKELRKRYIPHLFNIKQNKNYEGAFPEASFYSPDQQLVKRMFQPRRTNLLRSRLCTPSERISMATVKEKTDMASAVLRSKGFQVVELREHEFSEQKKKNPQLQKILDSHSIQNRLNPRDAFFGG